MRVFMWVLLLATSIPPLGVARAREPSHKRAFVNRQLETLSAKERALNEAFLREILNANPGEELRVLLEMLTVHTTVWVPRPALVRLGDSAVPPLRRIVSDPRQYAAARYEALICLMELGDEDAAAYAKKGIRPFAVFGSSGRGAEGKFQSLWLTSVLKGMDESERLEKLTAMLHDENLGTIAIKAMIEMGEPAIVPLVRVLRDKTHPFRVRNRALLALRQIECSHCATVFIDILSNPSESEPIRAMAASSLAYYDDPAAIPVLQKAIVSSQPNDRGTRVKRAACSSLRLLGASGADCDGTGELDSNALSPRPPSGEMNEGTQSTQQDSLPIVLYVILAVVGVAGLVFVWRKTRSQRGDSATGGRS